MIRVLREQNVQVAAGQIGQPPIPTGQDFQYTLNTLGRLTEPEQFANIVLKTGSNGEITYLRDVSRSELGAKNLDQLCRLDGRPGRRSIAWRKIKPRLTGTVQRANLLAN